ncbi:2-C-methyl-D-erythritol 4-phosphate cytidylyltransferase [Vibrio sp. SCSIO 43135]|uniref:2-C-methyl-D-erythritol 4-phosphate cytidylyltransferase n=1 Tax=Vibrio sp. SCSIO 43135 TaxID=2819096 RepID=UPI00207573B6|nr:2-C-methyl-D-erythritol 4-phosphate cytidylyltransferase [Vibrio sp. SCSIO 43135]USD41562.1 2-C-methyl-D-erythritol 4-phosphate cytidylyltransferase [Vibrio sp. SCSIO 43135]
MSESQSIVAIVPAAGVGSRMKADRPKQYLMLQGKSVLEHTIEKLLTHSHVDLVVVAITDGDPYFPTLPISKHPKVIRVSGGKERADSVLSALQYINNELSSDWVMVHDAARPCVNLEDIDALVTRAYQHEVGAILAAPVRDTMKRSNNENNIDHTVEREALWHALTPQMFPTRKLCSALEQALQQGVTITDEASAFEWLGQQPALVAGRADNLKITQPEDLDLADFYLSRQAPLADDRDNHGQNKE